MQTVLSRFCEEFVRTIRPLQAPLGRAAEVIASAPRDVAAALQTPLVDLRRQVELLSNKVRDQQAYVLIFGPLKSGKSTLMNAIAAGYVSEVSSLPAYPCMVFVQHASRRSYEARRYDGRVERFESAEKLEEFVGTAHEELAARIREIEATGQTFDPRQHLHSAIDRIDIKLPAGGLGESRAILVDTPGLYSRMKFGYSRMTRDFRNAAACAVFVVRSDNLFLEQVFAEFTDLLELFSRIFLLVNIDSTKQDLSSDGRLVPSLEQRDPTRVVQAFENLAMTAPLKQAAESGRLRIYPVDLLRAASARIRNVDDGAGARRGFDRFFDDLTKYLNSTDYMVAFLGDSLRRARTLLTESVDVTGHGQINRLRKRIDRLVERREHHKRGLAAIERLEGFGWEDQLASLSDQLNEASRDVAQHVGERSSRALHEAMRSWFAGDASFQQLVKGELVPRLTTHQEELINAISKEVSERLVHDGVGFAIPEEIRTAMAECGIDAEEIGRAAHRGADRAALVAVPPTPLRTDHVELRPRVHDRLLLRSKNGLRKRLFGPAEAPGQRLSAAQKEAFLGQPARQAMARRLAEYERSFFKETTDRIVAGFARGYTERVATAVRQALRQQRDKIEREATVVAAELANGRRLLEPFDAVREQAVAARGAIERLTAHYSQMDLFMLTQPVENSFQIPRSEPEKKGASKPAGSSAPPPAPAAPAAQAPPGAKATPGAKASPAAKASGSAKPGRES